MRTITFICVNFNNSAYTQELCNSLSTQIGRNDKFIVRCIVVDNSTDIHDSADLSKYSEPLDWVQYLRSNENLGYFGGLNLGLRRFRSQESEYVVVCNNDLVFDEDFCMELCDAVIDEKIFALCPDVIAQDKCHQNPHIADRISYARRLQFDMYFSHYYVARLLALINEHVLYRSRKAVYCADSRYIHMGIGACYVLTKNFFKNFDQLEYPVFLYGEEAFFSHQIHSRGGLLLYEPKLKVHHAEGASFSDMPKRLAYEAARQGYPLYRNLL